MSKRSARQKRSPRSAPARAGRSGGRQVPFHHPPDSPFAQTDGTLLTLIILFAFVLRLIYIWQYQSSPFFDHPIMDPRNHDLWARSIAAGQSFLEGHPYFRAPLYPWFLAVCYRLLGDGYLAPRLVQAVLGAMSCGLVFLIGRHYFGRWAGAVAGVLAATFWLFLYFEGELLIVPLILFLDLLFLWLFIRARETGSLRTYVLSGFILGVSALARPNILLVGALAAFWIVAANWREGSRAARRRAIRQAALLGLACLLPILPVTIRNAAEGHDFVLISSQGGVNLYIGNHSGSDGTTPELPGGMADWRGSYFESIAMAERAEGHPLRPSEVSHHFTREALRFATGDPAAWLTLTLRKLHYFWNGVEIGNNQPIRFFAHRYAPIVHFLPIGYWLIGPLGLLGLLLSLRQTRRFFPLWGFVAAYSTSIIIFFVCTRFKMPVMPVLIILAAGAGQWLLQAVRQRHWRPVVLAGLALAPLCWWVNAPPDTFDPQDAHGYEIIGMREMERGNVSEAMRCFRDGLEALPRYPAGLHINLGHALLSTGNATAAEREFQLGLQTQARHPREFARGTLGLAAIAEENGDTERAIHFLRETLRLDPADAVAHQRLGDLLIRQGAVDESTEQQQSGGERREPSERRVE